MFAEKEAKKAARAARRAARADAVASKIAGEAQTADEAEVSGVIHATKQ